MIIMAKRRSALRITFFALATILLMTTSLKMPIALASALSFEDIRWVVMCQSDTLYSQNCFNQLKQIGVQAVLCGIPWKEFEPSNGVFDFSSADIAYQKAQSAGLLWIPQIALHYAPNWLYSIDYNFHWMYKNGSISWGDSVGICPPNFFDPQTFYYSDRAINAFIDHFKNAQMAAIFVSTGEAGESYYPEGNFFAAFDPNTIAAWRQYTGNSNAMPYSSPTANDGSGGTLQQFLDWWYQKMYEFISHEYQLISSRLPNVPLGLKISYYPDLGQITYKQALAALPYNLRIISFGGPLSQPDGSTEVGEVAKHYGLKAWVESFLRSYNGATNSVEETITRINQYSVDTMSYSTIGDLMNIDSSPLGEFWLYKDLISRFHIVPTTDFLVNPGFADGLKNWYSSISYGTVNWSSIGHIGGSVYLSTGIAGSAYLFQDVLYPGGTVSIGWWHYLLGSLYPSSIFIKIEGYDRLHYKKVQLVYWAGQDNWEYDNAKPNQTGGYYAIKIQLPDSTRTGVWIYSTASIDFDIDANFGSGTWNSLNLTSLRIKLGVWGDASCSGYIDDITLTFAGCPTGLTQITGATLGSAALVSDGSKLHMVVRGTDNGIYYRSKTSAGSWTSWIQIPGATNDVPAIVILEGRLHLIVRGTDNGIYHSYIDTTTGTWSGWVQIPGATSSSPALTASSGTLHLVVRGTDNGIYYAHWTAGSGWSSWTQIPGATNDVPAIAVVGSKLHLVVRGTDNAIYHKMMNLSDRSWTAWTEIPGAISSSPSVVAIGSDRLDMVVRGTDNGIYHKVWSSASGWSSNWETISGATNDKPVLIVASTSLSLAVRGTDNAIYFTILDLSGGVWSDWIQVSGAILSYPSLATSDGQVNMVVRGTNNGIYYIYWT